MQAFTVDPRRSRTVRSLGRNPLVRAGDRVEAAAVAFAVMASVLVAPVATSLGTSVYDTRSKLYIARAQTISAQPAIVTAARVNEPSTSKHGGYSTVTVRWKIGSIVRTNTLISHAGAGVGDQFDIWVNHQGNQVQRPPGRAQAAVEAVGVAVSIWLGMVACAMALVSPVRWGLGALRDARWEREIKALGDNDGGQ